MLTEDVKKFTAGFCNTSSEPYNKVETPWLPQKKGLQDSQGRPKVMKPSWKVRIIAFRALPELDKVSAESSS